MTVLAENEPLKILGGDYLELPADATGHPYEGSMCSLRSDGYAGALTAGERFIGHAVQECDNSAGANAAKNVKLMRGIYRLEATLASVAITDVGKNVYASDDNTLTLTQGQNTFVGRVADYVKANTAIIEYFGLTELDKPFSTEFDCQTTIDTAAHVLIPGWMNPNGLVITAIFGYVTEVMAGGDEDQGIVTVSDESDNSLAVLTPSDEGADAVGDVVEGYFLQEAATGAAHKKVAAGEYVDAIVTQETSGADTAGKMRVFIQFVPLY